MEQSGMTARPRGSTFREGDMHAGCRPEGPSGRIGGIVPTETGARLS